MFKKADKKANGAKRHLRVRKKISGTPERPRLSVYRSEKNIYAQIIDDINAVTLVSASTLDKEVDVKVGGNKESVTKRVAQFNLSEQGFEYKSCPVQFWDVFGEQGHPVRTTISELGPLLL